MNLLSNWLDDYVRLSKPEVMDPSDLIFEKYYLSKDLIVFFLCDYFTFNYERQRKAEKRLHKKNGDIQNYNIGLFYSFLLVSKNIFRSRYIMGYFFYGNIKKTYLYNFFLIWKMPKEL